MEPSTGMPASGVASELVNAAGERERDRRSARFNLVEALVVFSLMELAIWGLIAEVGMARGSGLGAAAGYGLLGLCALHVVALSPWLHRDTAQAWGLPRRGSLRASLYAAAPEERRRVRRALVAAAFALALALCQGWPNLLARLGFRRHFRAAFEWLTGSGEGVALGIGLAVLALLPAASLAVRLDNFGRSLRAWTPAAAALWLGALVLAVGYALATGDYSGLRPGDWLESHPDRTSAIFYLLWGFAQLGLCLGYFNTRLRRGIGPRRRGPLSARTLTALANGLLFGLVHLPLLPLAALTFVEGATLAWYFQSDETRNLFIAAFVHAVAGTLFSAMLPFSTNIGPWH